jgi:hypothetical protein
LLKNFMGKIRIPRLDDTVSSEAANTAINHIFAGTMARTLSQSCSSKEDDDGSCGLGPCICHRSFLI